MQTIIHKTDTYSGKDNLVLAVTNFSSLEPGLFTEAERKYMRAGRRAHKTDFFAFNRLNNWIFVFFINRERGLFQRLETYREKGAKLQSLVNGHKLNAVVIADLENRPREILALAEGLALSNYQFLKYKFSGLPGIPNR